MDIVDEESLRSPIVINDKMLSHSADTQLRGLLTPNDLEIYQAIQQGSDPADTAAITSILMDLNNRDYKVNRPVNELLKMM